MRDDTGTTTRSSHAREHNHDQYTTAEWDAKAAVFERSQQVSTSTQGFPGMLYSVWIQTHLRSICIQERCCRRHSSVSPTLLRNYPTGQVRR